MKTISTSQKEKLDAALALLTEDATTFDKFEHIRTLIKSIHPDIDKNLSYASNAIKKLKKVQSGDIISLSAESLPEETEEQKKRKKALLFFISCWKDLKAEVKRVQELYQQQQTEGKTSPQHHASTLGKVFSFAKGPFGLVTLAALGIVGAGMYLKSSLVSVTIKNRGCAPMTPVVRLPISIPGIKLPTETIPDGGQTVATLPPFTITVDGSKSGTIKLTAFSFTMDYTLQGSGIDLIFDTQSLLGKQTTINLGQSKMHELLVQCTTQRKR